jgi:hypothetical protein
VASHQLGIADLIESSVLSRAAYFLFASGNKNEKKRKEEKKKSLERAFAI